MDTRVSGSLFCVDLGLHVCPWEFLRIYVSNPYKSRAVTPLSVVFFLSCVVSLVLSCPSSVFPPECVTRSPVELCTVTWASLLPFVCQHISTINPSACNLRQEEAHGSGGPKRGVKDGPCEASLR